jgi:hypothetical protein
MIQQVRKGDLIEVSFRDHAEGTDHFHFTTWGRVISQTKLAIVVCGWNYETPTQEIDPHDSNVIVHTILKSTITSMFRLVRKIA